MPAPPDAPSPRHAEALQGFIDLWGEMASRWGINRTMAQIHALLYASERPLDTDEIMQRLSISRGNANTNLRALVEWSLVRRTQRPGSRKDYYSAEKDVWTITTTIIEQRRQREIRPVQQSLARAAAPLRAGPPMTAQEAQFDARLQDLLGFLEVFEGFTNVFVPFLRRRNAAQVRRVIRFAHRLRRSGQADDLKRDVLQSDD